MGSLNPSVDSMSLSMHSVSSSSSGFKGSPWESATLNWQLPATYRRNERSHLGIVSSATAVFRIGSFIRSSASSMVIRNADSSRQLIFFFSNTFATGE
jgi:hypothetical protein